MTSYPSYHNPPTGYTAVGREPPVVGSSVPVPSPSLGRGGSQHTTASHGTPVPLSSPPLGRVGGQHSTASHGTPVPLPSPSVGRVGSQHTMQSVASYPSIGSYAMPALPDAPFKQTYDARSSGSQQNVQPAAFRSSGSQHNAPYASRGSGIDRAEVASKRWQEANAVNNTARRSQSTAGSQPAGLTAGSNGLLRGQEGMHGDVSLAHESVRSPMTRGAVVSDWNLAPRSSSSSVPRDAAANDEHGAPRMQGNRFRVATHLITFTLRLAALIRPTAPVHRGAQGSESGESISIPHEATSEEVNRQIVQEQLRESTTDILENGEIDFEEDTLHTFRGVAANCVILLILVFALSIILLYISGWIVLIIHGQDPCDVPLAPWLLVVMCFNAATACAGARIRRCLYMTFWNWDPEEDEEISLCMKTTLDALHFSMVMGICFSGLWLIDTSKTCSDTAPILFGWVRIWIRLMLFLVVLRIVITVCGVALIAFLIAAGVWKTNDGADPDIIHLIETVTYEEAGEGAIHRAMAQSLTMLNSSLTSECSICFENYIDKQELKFTPCNHLFHEECLRNWLKIKRTCPLCRLDLQEALLHHNQDDEESTLEV
eukprot:GEMP01013700.1.p1 GENE.GEMP01013700.1~~GEMP01013700.1.p1  ORF type:complete len:601 (+),score=128.73 GEMP01013700.1:274-2076(+)